MKKTKKIINCLFVTSGILLCGSGCTGSTKKEIILSSLKEGLQYLNKQKNYTFKYQNAVENSTAYMIFEEGSIGFKNEETQIHYIQDSNGIYPLTYDENYTPGEYFRDSNGSVYTSLWDNTFYTTLFNVESNYIESLDDSITELNISNKRYKVALIKTLGYTDKDYLQVEFVKCYFETNKLRFEIKFIKNESINYELINLNTTVNEDVEAFLSNNGKVFTPSYELDRARYLLKSNNFSRDIYNINTKQFEGIEIFHENYFYSEIFSYNYGSGAIELNQKANNEHDFDLYGCYRFDCQGSIKTMFTNVSMFPYASYETPNIVEMYHYPSYLSILNNLQYLKDGYIEEGIYTPNGISYYTTNMQYVYDFVYNFSFDSTYDPSTYKPYGLSIDLEINESDEESKITFVYYFDYNSKLYEVLIPLHNFNNSNVPLLDEIYSHFND